VIRAYRDYEFHLIYQKVHNFCVLDMGGFYLDVLKDRLYTTPAAGQPRRSAQTAMYHVAEAMVRWLAPVLAFTAEEIWSSLPGERPESVLLTGWHAFPEVPLRADDPDWDLVHAVRDDVARELEALAQRGAHRLLARRRAGALRGARPRGACCDAPARSCASCSSPPRRASSRWTSGRRTPSRCKASPTGCSRRWCPSTHLKCVRCWHRRPDIGAHPEHPEICGRCAENVPGDGERRRWA
jgi:isoleucyl-tRNA synthetase